MRFALAVILTTLTLAAEAQQAVFEPNIEARNFVNNIEVTGMAFEEAEPNYVTINVTFSEEANSTRSAIETIIQKTVKLRESLSVIDEESLEVTLDRYQIVPTYEGLLWDKFRVTQSLDLKLTDLKKISELVDLIALSEPYQMGQLDFQNDKIGEIEREVLKAAAEDARRQAEEILARTGGKLGAPLVVRFAPLNAVDFAMYDSPIEEKLRTFNFSSSESVMLEPSKNKITSRVQVTYQILPE